MVADDDVEYVEQEEDELEIEEVDDGLEIGDNSIVGDLDCG